MALLWHNLNVDGSPNYNTMHAGLPIVAGEGSEIYISFMLLIL
jgi:hypothetical protein